MGNTRPDDLATLNFKLYALSTSSSSGVGEVENPKITELKTTSLYKTEII